MLLHSIMKRWSPQKPLPLTTTSTLIQVPKIHKYIFLMMKTIQKRKLVLILNLPKSVNKNNPAEKQLPHTEKACPRHQQVLHHIHFLHQHNHLAVLKKKSALTEICLQKFLDVQKSHTQRQK